LSLQHHSHAKKTNGDSKIADRVSQIASHPLKQKSVAGSNMPQNIPRRMDELQTHTNTTFQPIDLEHDGYSSGASPLLSSRESLLSHVEIESPSTIIMSVMVTKVTSIKEQLASMEATMDRILEESAEKDAQIKRQNKQIANLIKKLEKQPIEASNKCSDAEDSDD